MPVFNPLPANQPVPKKGLSTERVKDVLMGIPKRDLLGMNLAVLQTVGFWYSLDKGLTYC